MDTIYTNDMFHSTSLLKDIHQNMQLGFLKGWNDANDAMCLMSRETGIMTWGGRQWQHEFSDQTTLTSMKVGPRVYNSWNPWVDGWGPQLGFDWQMNNNYTKQSRAESECSDSDSILPGMTVVSLIHNTVF